MIDSLSLLRKRAAQKKRASENPPGGRSPNGPTQSLRKGYRGSTGAPGPPAAIRLREAIEGAWYWGELEEALRNVDRAVRDGALRLEEAKELALLVGTRSRELPEKTSDRAR